MNQFKTRERWEFVVGYEGNYQVSNMGRIKSLARTTTSGRPIQSKIMAGRTRSDGYRDISLSRNGSRKTIMIHRLVALAFIENKDEKKCVNHKNSKRSDNRLSNLEWATHAENTSHGIESGGINFVGSKNKNSKLDEMAVVLIRKRYSMGEVTYQHLADIYSVSKVAIHAAIKRKSWRHVK